jgi:hypothetical protein
MVAEMFITTSTVVDSEVLDSAMRGLTASSGVIWLSSVTRQRVSAEFPGICLAAGPRGKLTVMPVC